MLSSNHLKKLLKQWFKVLDDVVRQECDDIETDGRLFIAFFLCFMMGTFFLQVYINIQSGTDVRSTTSTLVAMPLLFFAFVILAYHIYRKIATIHDTIRQGGQRRHSPQEKWLISRFVGRPKHLLTAKIKQMLACVLIGSTVISLPFFIQYVRYKQHRVYVFKMLVNVIVTLLCLLVDYGILGLYRDWQTRRWLLIQRIVISLCIFHSGVQLSESWNENDCRNSIVSMGFVTVSTTLILLYILLIIYTFNLRHSGVSGITGVFHETTTLNRMTMTDYSLKTVANVVIIVLGVVSIHVYTYLHEKTTAVSVSIPVPIVSILIQSVFTVAAMLTIRFLVRHQASARIVPLEDSEPR